MGLSSLIPNRSDSGDVLFEEGNVENSSSEGIVKIPVDSVVSNPNQPRCYFDEDSLKKLSESIKEYGVIQPILVTKINPRRYELIAGERRLQASKLAGLEEIPAIVKTADGQEKLEIALVENIQRHDLNPIEEARAYKKLRTEFNLTQKETAKRVGKSRSAVTNIIRLLELPIEIQRGLIEEKITEGHARAILGLKSKEEQRALYDLVLKDHLSVRAVENKVREILCVGRRRTVKETDPRIQNLEDKMQQKFGTKVEIKKNGASGRIIINFYSEEEFDRIVNII